jgi:hypothetical protein
LKDALEPDALVSDRLIRRLVALRQLADGLEVFGTEGLAAVGHVQHAVLALALVEQNRDLSFGVRGVGVVGVLDQFVEEPVLVLALHLPQQRREARRRVPVALRRCIAPDYVPRLLEDLLAGGQHHDVVGRAVSHLTVPDICGDDGRLR